MSIDALKYLKVSRPKFWLYLLGPYFLGATLAIERVGQLALWPFWLLFFWFTLPANLLLYGVNDAFDYDTDQHNPKKARDETLVYPHERKALLSTILLLSALAAPALLASNPQVLLFFGLFVALAAAYSTPPLRFKARPVFDSISNMLYLTPLLVSWSFYSSGLPPLPLIVAGVLWCMSMHAYSAIPDIESDRRAGLSTIATLLGYDRTLLFCLACWTGAAFLVAAYDLASGLLLGLYPILILLQWAGARHRVRQWYRYFPMLNGLVGMCLTLRFLYPLPL